MVEKLVILKNITKTYKTGKIAYQVLKGINLEVEEKEFLAIMGASGSGKTTLLNIIGLLDKPDSGIYIFDGQEVSKLNKNDLAYIRNRKIGFVFQAFHLVPWATALENVLMPLLYRGVFKKEDEERALQLLTRLGLEKRMNAKPSELSGGEQQRVAIARALITHPKLLLADEPTGNLDSKSSQEVMKIFKELNEEGLTIIMVTHDPEIAKFAQRIKIIKDGVFVEK
ncbi:Phosphonate-transporting ATPase [Thermodesulfobacterium geofontis OPF15]|uniref:Phosphonate-transporting ATPase n=1 Tax=Thermodesulfobacterium geofontis (strain OPF15) TaxID=795359 RepID=F8C4R2_THEGP|nr:ABC transporter ATP-binding protein [Thermodesulfobacterium geofontis]AEH23160.1 Phosphonate-transporting ATPase [Thermodesulfobacterium geofontis OPF15]